MSVCKKDDFKEIINDATDATIKPNYIECIEKKSKLYGISKFERLGKVSV